MMKKIRIRMISLFLVFIMLLFNNLPSIAIAQDPDKVSNANNLEVKKEKLVSDIRLNPAFKNQDGSYKTNYLTHEKFTFNAGFSISNTTGHLDDIKFVITMPAKFINVNTLDNHNDDDGIQISELSSADNAPTIELKEGNWVITYSYSKVPGGYASDVPISIRTTMGDTPNGYKLPITVNVVDKEGNVLPEASIKKEFTFNTQKPEFRKRIGVDKEIEDINPWETPTLDLGLAKDENGDYLSGELNQKTIPEKQKPVNFRFDLYEKSGNKGEGTRKYENIVISDKLPEGAVFYEELNPGWVKSLNSEGETILTYEVNYPNGVDFNYKPAVNKRQDYSPIKDSLGKPIFLKLYFPGVKVKENGTYKEFLNSANVELTPHKMQLEDRKVTLNNDVKFKIEAKKPTIEISKMVEKNEVQNIESAKSKEQKWIINVKNYNDVDLSNLYIKDFLGTDFKNNSQANQKTREELELVRLKINSTKETVFKGSFDIYTKDIENNKTLLENNVSIINGYTKDLPKGTVSIELRATESSIFYGQGYEASSNDGAEKRLNLEVFSKFKDSTPKEISSSEYKWNSVEVNADSETKSLSGKAQNKFELVPVERYTKLEKTVVDKKNIYHINTNVKFRLKAWLGNLYKNEKYDVVRIVDLLPEFTEYVQGSTKKILDERFITKNSNLEPKIVENYLGLGQTALIWEFGPFENLEKDFLEGRMDTNFYNLEMTYELKILRGAINELENSAYLGFEGGPERKPIKSWYSNNIEISSDKLDVNNNGNFTDKVSKGFDKFKVATPRELVGTKYVRGSEDKSYIASSGHALSEINGNGVYRLRLQNTNSLDYDYAVIVDVLPYNSDYTLSSVTSSKETETKYRNSNFEIKITGPIEFTDPYIDNGIDTNNAQERYDIFYSFDRPISEEEISNYLLVKENWKTKEEVNNQWDKVKAIKIKLKEGKIIEQESEDNFYIKFNMPSDSNLTLKNEINNSFSFSTNSQLSGLTESNIVKLKPIFYEVKGISWDDKNNDGIYSSDESLLPNTKVTLMEIKEDGSIQVAKDLNGIPYEAKTNENGEYSIKVFTKGKYFIKMERPNGYIETTLGNSDKSSNHLKEYSENDKYIYSKSSEFELNTNKKEAVLNGGWSKVKTPIIETEEEKPVVPETVGEPRVPSVPETVGESIEPKVPETSEEPRTPEVPEVPEVSETVGEPKVPETSIEENPEVSETIKEIKETKVLETKGEVGQKVSARPNSSEKTNKPTNPKTGDAGISIYLLILLSSGFIINLLRKKNVK